MYKNSIYLMLSTAVMSFLGFFFWMITARFYSTEQVGLGTTLFSIMALITNFSLLGLGNGLIRYLSASDRKNKKINTSFTIVTLVSILISVIYLIFMKTFSPKLLFVKENIYFALLFILFTACYSLNVLSDYVFIAYRSSGFVLIKNTISSTVKLIFPIFLVTMGAFGIFVSMGISMAIAFFFSLLFLILRFNYVFKPGIDRIVVSRMAKFSFGNYVGELIGSLPVTILPILITNLIGAKYSAFFYMDMMIANLLYIIPKATSQSLFAEGSYNEAELKLHLKKSVKIISIIIIPVIIVIFVFGKFILLAFGKNYSDEGFILLRFLSISGIFISISCLGYSILNIKHKVKLNILLSIVNAAITLILSVILIKTNLFGVVGVGIAWIAGQIIEAVIYLFLMKKFLK
jgi:O-antigen/teichoic acid export membrane protein